MLNNDFKELTKKYTRYQKQKQRSRSLKILFFFLALAGLVYFISIFYLNKPTKTKVIETNATTVSQPAKVEKNTTEEATTEKLEINKHGLQVTTQEDSLEQLTANQKKSKSYSATISLANYHYSKKEYADAVKWAIEASKMNKKKDRPWIVYAQSKLAVGKVDIAKKALGLYLKKHKSKEAQDLLDKLNSI